MEPNCLTQLTLPFAYFNAAEVGTVSGGSGSPVTPSYDVAIVDDNVNWHGPYSFDDGDPNPPFALEWTDAFGNNLRRRVEAQIYNGLFPAVNLTGLDNTTPLVWLS